MTGRIGKGFLPSLTTSTATHTHTRSQQESAPELIDRVLLETGPGGARRDGSGSGRGGGRGLLGLPSFLPHFTFPPNFQGSREPPQQVGFWQTSTMLAAVPCILTGDSCISHVTTF